MSPCCRRRRRHVYMAPCRSSSRCSRCFLLSCRGRKKNKSGRAGRHLSDGEGQKLTLSFLNSSYSGLSVGSSRRQSGQEFVYECKRRRRSSDSSRKCRTGNEVTDLLMEFYLPQPRQDASGVEEVFTRHLSNRLLFLELQQTHRTLQTFI